MLQNMAQVKTDKPRTKAQIPENILIWHFGIELGMIDCSVKTVNDLEKLVDNQYTKQEIINSLLQA